jgi:phosphate transport system substrate-binding protein
LDKEKLLQFPAIIGAVVPVINIPEIDSEKLKLSQSLIALIFSGKITHWDNDEIKKLNPEINLPKEKIILVCRSDRSGTTAIFTKFLSETNTDFKETVGFGKSVKWPDGLKAKGNSGVSNYIKRFKYSIGYVGNNFVKKNRLQTFKLQTKSNSYILPNVKSFQNAAQYADWRKDNHFESWLINSKGNDSWPITAASFILIPRNKMNSEVRVC